jgi:outer membrane protein OmpA-like peptidoglycan-associated protein
MSDRIGKCTNFENCGIAYRNEPVRIKDGCEPVCTECGKPLTETVDRTAQIKSAGKLIGTVLGVIAFGALLVGVFILTRSLQETSIPEPTSPTPAPTAEPTPEVRRAEPVSPAQPAEAPAGTPVAAAIPVTGDAEMPVAVPRITATGDSGVKRDVLARIDAMPNLGSAEKDKLYTQVDRARALMKIVTIPFDTGGTELTSAQANQLCAELQREGIQRLIHNPTVVFVLLGFADKAGDSAKNLRLSRERAEGVQRALRNTCGLANITHPVGMGGSEMFGAENRGKNRVAEVWAVLP